MSNFRKIKSTTFEFTSGLNVILGPNNIGKTALVDSLRCLLAGHEEPYFRLTTDDFHCSGSDDCPPSEIVFEYLFTELSEADEADFLHALVPNQSESFDARLTIVYSQIDGTDKLRAKRWCGAREDVGFNSEMMDNLRGVYLQPLRDASQGLRPGRNSQLGRLMRLLGDKDQKGKELVEKALLDFEEELKQKGPIKDTQNAITDRHASMMGEHLSQLLDLGIAGTDFKRLSSRLSLLVDKFEVEMNGLGFNNLIYMAVVLSEMIKDPSAAYRGLIVEEPEAHLHPQLQNVLLQYLQEVVNTNKEQSVQIFVTSHSPNFASSAKLDSITCLSMFEQSVRTFSPRSIFPAKDKKTSKLKSKLERYLDVTRAELFFARKVIFVEGAAELLLINEIAKKLGAKFDLKRNAVSLISVEGLNFDCFIPLFGETKLAIPVAIITDADPSSGENSSVYPDLDVSVKPSDNVRKLLENEEDLLRIFYGVKTLEYDLALYSENRNLMLKALAEIHPEIAKKLSGEVNTAKSNSEKARTLFSGMFEDGARVQKGRFAQEFAQYISESDEFRVPDYIEDAIKHVCQS